MPQQARLPQEPRGPVNRGFNLLQQLKDPLTYMHHVPIARIIKLSIPINRVKHDQDNHNQYIKIK